MYQHQQGMIIHQCCVCGNSANIKSNSKTWNNKVWNCSDLQCVYKLELELKPQIIKIVQISMLSAAACLPVCALCHSASSACLQQFAQTWKVPAAALLCVPRTRQSAYQSQSPFLFNLYAILCPGAGGWRDRREGSAGQREGPGARGQRRGH